MGSGVVGWWGGGATACVQVRAHPPSPAPPWQLGAAAAGATPLPLSGFTATQSSTAAGAVADRAVDGNPATFAQTSAEKQPWLMLDLGSQLMAVLGVRVTATLPPGRQLQVRLGNGTSLLHDSQALDSIGAVGGALAFAPHGSVAGVGPAALGRYLTVSLGTAAAAVPLQVFEVRRGGAA